MSQKYFYYVRALGSLNLVPRKASEWPPIGGEPNPVVWKTEITEGEFRRRLSALDLKYKDKAKAYLT